MNEAENINQLPKDWKWVKLGDACNIIMGQSPPSTSYNANGIGLPFFQGKAEFTDLYPIVEKWCNAPNKIAEPNDILLSVRAPVGTTNIANQKCCIGRGLAAIRYENYKYAFYFLRSRQQELDSKGTGTTFRAISGETIRETLFPFPPKPTQQAIVSKIEELFSELDKGIENLRTAQQQLKTYRQSVLKWAFVNENFKDFILKDVTEKIQIGPFGTQLHKEDYIDNGIPLINPTHIKGGFIVADTSFSILKSKRDSLPNYILKEGDVIMGRRGEMGRCGLVTRKEAGWFCGTGSLYFRPDVKKVNPVFLYYNLSSQSVKKYLDDNAGGTTMANLNLKIVNDIPISLPTIKEQNKIVQEIESRLSVADKMEESITQSLQHAEALRQSILKKAFEGKLIATETMDTIEQTAKVIPIERKVLAGKIIHLLNDDKYFGLTKFQKILYLVENYTEVSYDTNFIQERAGPYDKAFTTAFRKEMQEQNWFMEEQRGSITKFITGNKVGSLIKDFAKYFRSNGAKISFVLLQLKDKSTHEAELIATLYAVWNNRLITKKPIKIELLIEDFFNWSAKKKEEFHEGEIKEIFAWMNDINLVPSGFGKVIGAVSQ